VAFAGAILSFALIRGKDFVASEGAAPPPSETEPELAAAG
jgi:hypothetical protein